MQITWYGLSCFKITSGETTILVSPFAAGVGLNPPKGKADIVLVSEDTGGSKAKFPEGSFVISGEGEYEARGILVNGSSFFHPAGSAVRKSTVYTVHLEGVTLCHLDRASKEQVDGLLEQLGEVDVLMIPVGGGARQKEKGETHTLNAEEAVAVVGEVEPRIVIPMYYGVSGLKQSLSGPEEFLKAMGAKGVQPVEKLILKKKDLPQEETKVVLLSCGN